MGPGRRRQGLVAAGVVVIALSALGIARLPRGAGGRAGAHTGAGAALARAVRAATRTSWRRPARCVGAGAPVPDLVLAGERTYRLERGRLVGGRADGKVKLGVVADARGGGADHLAAARKAFAAARVDAVIALGGMGETKDEILAALRPIAERAPWIVVAIAGDREAAAAHAAAVEALVAAGAPVVDGGAARVVVIDGVAIGFLPGVGVDRDGRAHGLVAGLEGCGRDDTETDAVADALAAEAEPRVLASWAAPRQRGAGATDLTIGGVHVGEPSVARAAERARAGVVVHAQVDETGGRAAAMGEPGARGGGTVTHGTVGAGGTVVASGALDDAPRARRDAAIAVIVEVSRAGKPRLRALAGTHTGRPSR
jgi:hypothetical protein